MTAPTHPAADPIIPALERGVTGLRAHAFLATLAGLAVRLLFVLRFPADAGDSALYIELARNWAEHHVYGMWMNGSLVPVDLRMPGYPAFLAGVALFLGRSRTAILLSQAVLDLGTCFLAAALAALLAPIVSRRRVVIAALWLAALCPFTANYAAVPLTETLTAFLTTAALVFFAWRLHWPGAEGGYRAGPFDFDEDFAILTGAFLTGLATLVRPEMPLLMVVAAMTFALRWWQALGWKKIVRAETLMAIAFLVPIAPWAVRNGVTLHEFQPLAPRYATLPDEYAPTGYYAWTKTWLVHFRDVYVNLWPLDEDTLDVDNLPPAAFDTPEEKARVAALLDRYDDTIEMSPEIDRGFAELARERTARHPLRTYLWVPLRRALTIWFTPRTELTPETGQAFPLRERWEDDRADVITTLGFALADFIYVGLAIAGIWRALRLNAEFTKTISNPPYLTTIQEKTRRFLGEIAPSLPGVALIVAFLVVRTLFLTTVETPEPRYVVICFPAVVALGALAWARRRA